MRLIPTATGAVTALALAAGIGTADIAATPAINAAAGTNLPTASAEAYWWHFTVREWGGICGYDWQHSNLYEVERWAYSWTSSTPKCQDTGNFVRF